MLLQGKVIVVTGAGSGIGQQIALLLLERGATVAAVDINSDGLQQTNMLADHHAVLNRVSLHTVDISNRQSVERLAVEVIQCHGCVDGIINNAGIIHPFIAINNLSYEMIDRVINVNLYGVVYFIKTFLPLLLERPEGHVTNISSMGGLFAFPNQSIYGASKAAVKVISEGLLTELNGTNVGVTVVYPGAIATDITKNCGAHNEKFDKAQKIYGGTPPKIAALRIVDAIESKKSRVLIGPDAVAMSILYRLFPHQTVKLVHKIMNLVISD